MNPIRKRLSLRKLTVHDLTRARGGGDLPLAAPGEDDKCETRDGEKSCAPPIGSFWKIGRNGPVKVC